MRLSASVRLVPYEMLSPIGAGGVGEVYKARDSRLNRVVALQVGAEKFCGRSSAKTRSVAAGLDLFSTKDTQTEIAGNASF